MNEPGGHEHNAADGSTSPTEQQGARADEGVSAGLVELKALPAINGNDQAEKKTYTTREHTKFALEIIGVIIVSVYTVFSILSWKEMVNATKATKDSLVITDRSMRLDKRAWVGVVAPAILVHFIIDPGSQNYEVSHKFMIENFGPGVALNVVTDFEAANKHSINKSFAETCEVAAQHYPKRNDSDIKGGYTLFPEQQISVPNTELGNMEQLHSEGGLYVVGCILYEDQFGDHHKTASCFRTLSDMDGGAVSNKPQGLYACPSDAN